MVRETAVPNAQLQAAQPEEPPDGADIEVVAEDLDRPIAFVYAPDGRLFFTEKETGLVRVIVDGELLPAPVLSVTVGANAEQGLLGITLDPDFANNHAIWVIYTVPARENEGEKVNRVVRFVEKENIATEVTTMLDLPNSTGNGTHNASNLLFGPDGKLYIGVGDDNNAHFPQLLDDPRGSILRFNPTTPLSAPEDNPFYDGDGPNYDGIYAHGFRNPFDLVVDPLQEGTHIFATENGPSCEDEINRILPGHNYGWNFVYDCDNENGLRPELNGIRPLLYWTPTTAPTGITIYTGDDFPEWYGDIFYCSYTHAQLLHVKLNATRDAAISHTAINGAFCQTDVFNGPDGALYFVEGGGYAQGTVKRLFRE